MKGYWLVKENDGNHYILLSISPQKVRELVEKSDNFRKMGRKEWSINRLIRDYVFEHDKNPQGTEISVPRWCINQAEIPLSSLFNYKLKILEENDLKEQKMNVGERQKMIEKNKKILESPGLDFSINKNKSWSQRLLTSEGLQHNSKGVKDYDYSTEFMKHFGKYMT